MTTISEINPEFLSEAVCAARLRVSPRTLRRLRRAKIIRAVKIENTLRYYWPSVVESLLQYEGKS